MSRRPALPISLYVSGRRVALMGEGSGAADRAARLSRAGAEIVPVPDPALAGEREPEGPSERARAQVEPLADCAALVIHPAAPPEERHERLAAAARSRGLLVYVHDRPELSDFAMPALARRGPIALAISTDGAAPALARRLREELDGLLAAAGEALDGLISQLEALRAALPPDRRGELYEAARRLSIEGRIAIAPERTG